MNKREKKAFKAAKRQARFFNAQLADLACAIGLGDALVDPQAAQRALDALRFVVPGFLETEAELLHPDATPGSALWDDIVRRLAEVVVAFAEGRLSESDSEE